MRQRAAQGGRIGFYEGGPSDKAGFGFGNFGKQGSSAPGSLGRPGGGKPDPDPQPSAEEVYGVSPNLSIAEEVQEQKFSPGDGKPDSFWSGAQDTLGGLITPDNVMKAILSAVVPGFGIMSTIGSMLGLEPGPAPDFDPDKQGGGGPKMIANVDLPTVNQTQTISPEISDLTADQNLELASLIQRGYPADYAESLVRVF